MNGPSSGLDTLILHKDSPKPEALPALAVLFQEAERAGWDVVVVAGEKTPDKSKSRAKRRHDLRAALRTIQLLSKALQGGYRFQGDDATAKIDAVVRATQVLEKEIQTIDQVFATDR